MSWTKHDDRAFPATESPHAREKLEQEAERLRRKLGQVLFEISEERRIADKERQDLRETNRRLHALALAAVGTFQKIADVLRDGGPAHVVETLELAARLTAAGLAEGA
jgi:hypothetical protein